MDDEEYCAICLEETKDCDNRILSCNHKFHTKCFSGWSKKIKINVNENKVTCPCCRLSFEDPLVVYDNNIILPSTEIVYVPFEIIIENSNYKKGVLLFLIIVIIQIYIIYLQINNCINY